MLIRAASRQAGASLVEIMIALTVLAISLAIGIPAFSEWLQNTQIRTATESMLAGIQSARSEALKRNAVVRFQMMSSIDAACAQSATGTNWVVSLGDAAGQCDVADPATPPNIVRIKSATEGTPNVTFQASQSSFAFNGLGMLTPAIGATATIDVANPTGGTCVADGNGGKMRCLRIQIASGGQVRMCDPSVSDNADPRKC